MANTFKDWPRFNGAAIWPTLTAEQQAEIGAIALEFVVCANGEDAYFGSDPCFLDGNEVCKNRPFVAGECALTDLMLRTVQDALADHVLALSDDSLPVPLPSLLGPVCRDCGCSEMDACDTGCAWIEIDLCSSCANAPGGGVEA